MTKKKAETGLRVAYKVARIRNDGKAATRIRRRARLYGAAWAEEK